MHIINRVLDLGHYDQFARIIPNIKISREDDFRATPWTKYQLPFGKKLLYERKS